MTSLFYGMLLIINFCFFKVNYSAVAESCNLWRNYADIQDSWSSVTGIIDYYAEKQVDLIPHAGPGHWNDPDMVTFNIIKIHAR